jgi:RNA polymerase sigma factor (sigma-70 family)
MRVETLDKMRGSGVTGEPLPAGGVHMGDGPTRPLRSRRLLRLARDVRLVEQIRRGNEAAFEVAFERHGPPVLAFCRHMLGSPEEAEDAVQHTFAAAYRSLRSGDRRRIELKPWLFTIARNHCVSVLRARREVPVEDVRDAPTHALAEQVERRAELRHLVADVRELPDEHRAALLLTEVGDLSHAEVAGVLGCEVSRVKALVYRARSQLIARRDARDVPCEQIREQLATLRGGALRRNDLRLHLRQCPGCRAYREEIRRQRQMLAAALPVVPAIGLKSSVLAAAGLGGSAGGATGLAGAIGGATVAKVAVAGALAGGGLVAADSVVVSDHPIPARPAPAQSAPQADGTDGAARGAPAGGLPARSDPDASDGRGTPPTRARDREGGAARDGAGPAREGAARARGRGPIAAPPGTTPVRRGPPDKAGKPAKPGRGGRPEKSGSAGKPEKAARVGRSGGAGGAAKSGGTGKAGGAGRAESAPKSSPSAPPATGGSADSLRSGASRGRSGATTAPRRDASALERAAGPAGKLKAPPALD